VTSFLTVVGQSTCPFAGALSACGLTKDERADSRFAR
jgi:hypothetical protein